MSATMNSIGRQYYLSGYPAVLIKYGNKGTCYVLVNGKIYKDVDRSELKAA